MDISKLISDVLSIITISMCLFIKVPQIMSIHKLKHARGMNIYGLLMELSSYSVMASYNFVNGYALLSYLEYPIIIIQQYVLIYLVLFYQNLIGSKAVAGALTYTLIVTSFLTKFIPSTILLFIVPLCTPVSLSSKAVQLWEILKKWNADSVSVSTWVISALSNASRIYTIYMDSSDLLLLSNFILSTFMSATVAITAFMLQKSHKHVD
ncbi:solute carrier family 66 member 3 [Rhodnius prolixus]|uniref:solute carrier family 66 member 3 n=1 Tax=Rhodnius prolixus TaxID=13249 RepID=UPI003D18D34E